jgi:hypothetical protein
LSDTVGALQKLCRGWESGGQVVMWSGGHAVPIAPDSYRDGREVIRGTKTPAREAARTGGNPLAKVKALTQGIGVYCAGLWVLVVSRPDNYRELSGRYAKAKRAPSGGVGFSKHALRERLNARYRGNARSLARVYND